jgi:RimJ/RimL family protein N-acetyltransferase
VVIRDHKHVVSRHQFRDIMKIKSLGYRTDLFFPTFDGQIIDRGNYLAIRTPKNPTFYWGNFLLFSQPPREGDFNEWRDLFAQEIGTPPYTEHQVFGWDSPAGVEGIIQPFLEAGFRLDRNVVLTSSEPSDPARPSSLVSIRPLKTESDWEQAVENQVACREPEFEEGEYREFQMKQMARYRKMATSGHGDWYGAFIEQKLVADLGLYHHEGVGRFQSVETNPDFRRRGIAGTMIVEASRQAKEKYNLHTLVIVADQDSSPARLYTSLGFELTEKQVGLEWWPKISLHKNEGG